MKNLLDYAKQLKNWFIAFNGDVGVLSVVTTIYETDNELTENYQTLSLGVIAFAYYLKNDNLSEFDNDDPKEFVTIDKLAYNLVYKANSPDTRQEVLSKAIKDCNEDNLLSVLVLFSALVEVLMKEGFKRV